VQRTKSQKLPRCVPVNRENYICDAVKQKIVLHIGCADYPFTEYKFNSGKLLHQKLAQYASRLIGIDVNKKAIDWLKDKSIEDLYVGDASNNKELLNTLGVVPDVIVAGEVLEHLNQPFLFLKEIRAGMQKSSELILSVPNAFHLENFIRVLLSYEKVHQEHIAYYSFYTIKQLIERCDMTILEIIPCTYQATNKRSIVSNSVQCLLHYLIPHVAPGYVVKVIR
jgi:2-polyprenyl-3-methyl-5-hydroxy-6-metoxy-1,4-benzoquinol methylase